MPEAGVSMRERKKRQTRLAIVEAALDLFAEHGYERVTMAEVAAAAEVAPRTVFRYVADKRDLVLGEEVRQDERLGAALAARPAEEAPAVAVLEALLDLVGTWQDLHATGRVRQRVVDASAELRAGSRAKQAAHEDVLAAGLVARGTPPQQARLLARTAVGCAEEGVQAWLAQDDPDRPGVQERVRGSFADLAGLVAPLGPGGGNPGPAVGVSPQGAAAGRYPQAGARRDTGGRDRTVVDRA